MRMLGAICVLRFSPDTGISQRFGTIFRSCLYAQPTIDNRYNRFPD